MKIIIDKKDIIAYNENKQSIKSNNKNKYKVKMFIYPFKRINKFIIYECSFTNVYIEDYIGEFCVDMLTGQIDKESICISENMNIEI